MGVWCCGRAAGGNGKFENATQIKERCLSAWSVRSVQGFANSPCQAWIKYGIPQSIVVLCFMLPTVRGPFLFPCTHNIIMPAEQGSHGEIQPSQIVK